MRLAVFSAISLMGLSIGCTNQCGCEEDPLSKKYAHQYGQPMSEQEWSARGSSGSVTTRLASGAVRVERYDQGQLHGDLTETFPYQETIAHRQVFERGAKVKEVRYAASGVPVHQQEWRGDQRVVTFWYPDGSPLAVETYEQERLITGNYYGKSGELDAQVVEGKGLRLCRDGLGKLVAKEEIVSGEVSLRTELFDDGAPRRVTPFYKSAVHGVVASYLPDGQPATVEHYHLGLRHGSAISYLNGEKAKEVPFVYGKREGVEQHFADGKTVVKTISWSGDLQHGPAETILPEAHRIEYWYRGKLVPKFTYERQLSKERVSQTLENQP
jgi:antitoxin component YwqK of YwqJK toxin-antitoxin module